MALSGNLPCGASVASLLRSRLLRAFFARPQARACRDRLSRSPSQSSEAVSKVAKLRCQARDDAEGQQARVELLDVGAHHLAHRVA